MGPVRVSLGRAIGRWSWSGVISGCWKRFVFFFVFCARPSRCGRKVQHGLSVRRCSANGEGVVYLCLFGVLGCAFLGSVGIVLREP